MANETTVTVTGNLTADPELRFTKNGTAVTTFTVASTPRTWDRQAEQWKDGEALFLRCSAWKQFAENIAESLVRGNRVVVQGRLRQRSYETKDGDKRSYLELEADDVGPSLRFVTAKPVRPTQTTGSDGSSAWTPEPVAVGAGEPPF